MHAYHWSCESEGWIGWKDVHLFGVGLDADDLEPSFDFMDGRGGKGIGEEAIETFMGIFGSDDFASPEKSAEGQDKPLRGVEHEHGGDFSLS